MVTTPNRDRRAEQRAATQQEILDAAWDVAHELGLASVTLREVAARVGMQAPSLYTHFDSKHAIFDAMFTQAWTDYLAVATAAQDQLPSEPRAMLKTLAGTFVDFALADLARHQLMNVRTIPGFAPSPQAYEPAVAVLANLRALLVEMGATGQDAVDLLTALVGGLIDQQWANDPGGSRWRRLLDRAMDMYADEMGLPGPRRRAR
ncbi:MAG: TetR/AcrR family transcriptional regulator [Nocardioidaceae bacterium]